MICLQTFSFMHFCSTQKTYECSHHNGRCYTILYNTRNPWFLENCLRETSESTNFCKIYSAPQILLPCSISSSWEDSTALDLDDAFVSVCVFSPSCSQRRRTLLVSPQRVHTTMMRLPWQWWEHDPSDGVGLSYMSIAHVVLSMLLLLLVTDTHSPSSHTAEGK